MRATSCYTALIVAVLGIAILVFSSCSTMLPGGIARSTGPVNQQEYQVLGNVEESETSTSFLFFQFNKPNKDWIEKVTQKATQKAEADELVNTAWYHTYTNYLLFSTYKFTMQGTAVRRTIPSQTTASGFTNPTTPTRQMSLQEPSPPLFNSVGFSIAMSKGSESEVFNFWDNDDKSLDGFSGMRLSIFTKNQDVPVYFYPQISYAKLGNEGTKKVEIFGFEEEINLDGLFIRTIPVTFNIGFNGSKVGEIGQNLPEGLNPYANIGLGYYLTEFGSGGAGDWKWTEFGYNFGLGVEYAFQPNLGLSFGFDRHSVIIGDNYSFWNLGLGLNYYMNR